MGKRRKALWPGYLRITSYVGGLGISVWSIRLAKGYYLRNELKDGLPQTYWYFIQQMYPPEGDDDFLEFDIRDIWQKAPEEWWKHSSLEEVKDFLLGLGPLETTLHKIRESIVKREADSKEPF